MEKITQQTIRLPEERNAKIKSVASRAGSSYNSFVNILIDIGLRVYESNPTFQLPSEFNPE